MISFGAQYFAAGNMDRNVVASGDYVQSGTRESSCERYFIQSAGLVFGIGPCSGFADSSKEDASGVLQLSVFGKAPRTARFSSHLFTDVGHLSRCSERIGQWRTKVCFHLFSILRLANASSITCPVSGSSIGSSPDEMPSRTARSRQPALNP